VGAEEEPVSGYGPARVVGGGCALILLLDVWFLSMPFPLLSRAV